MLRSESKYRTTFRKKHPFLGAEIKYGVWCGRRHAADAGASQVITRNERDKPMTEAVTFWLDNKVSSGIKMAEIGGQALVSYREKFYIVEGGAARMKGSKPLHFSKTSLPTIWKKALQGILPPDAAITAPEDDNLPRTTMTKKERMKMEKPTLGLTAQEEILPGEEQPRPVPAKQPAPPKSETRSPKTIRKSDSKPDAQTMVTTTCPYCNHKNELPVEKGKHGKPFFIACAKCSHEFAVRFTQVTVYQAQVAAFK
jgi:hypothetical protein